MEEGDARVLRRRRGLDGKMQGDMLLVYERQSSSVARAEPDLGSDKGRAESDDSRKAGSPNTDSRMGHGRGDGVSGSWIARSLV